MKVVLSLVLTILCCDSTQGRKQETRGLRGKRVPGAEKSPRRKLMTSSCDGADGLLCSTIVLEDDVSLEQDVNCTAGFDPNQTTALNGEPLLFDNRLGFELDCRGRTIYLPKSDNSILWPKDYFTGGTGIHVLVGPGSRVRNCNFVGGVTGFHHNPVNTTTVPFPAAYPPNASKGKKSKSSECANCVTAEDSTFDWMQTAIKYDAVAALMDAKIVQVEHVSISNVQYGANLLTQSSLASHQVEVAIEQLSVTQAEYGVSGTNAYWEVSNYDCRHCAHGLTVIAKSSIPCSVKVSDTSVMGGVGRFDTGFVLGSVSPGQMRAEIFNSTVYANMTAIGLQVSGDASGGPSSNATIVVNESSLCSLGRDIWILPNMPVSVKLENKVACNPNQVFGAGGLVTGACSMGCGSN